MVMQVEMKEVNMLEKVREEINVIDEQMKELFLKRMLCAKQVARIKEKTGGDVFVPERESLILQKRTKDIVPEFQEEYVAFLKHLMSICRKYEYQLLPQMQKKVIDMKLNETKLEETKLESQEKTSQVKITFTCEKEKSNLNLFLNMITLNKLQISSMNLTLENGRQKIIMVLDSSIAETNMQCLLCQLGKEAEDFQIIL